MRGCAGAACSFLGWNDAGIVLWFFKRLANGLTTRPDREASRLSNFEAALG